MAADPVTPSELWHAVQDVLKIREVQKQSIIRTRSSRLRELHSLTNAAEEGSYGLINVKDGGIAKEKGWVDFEREHKLIEGEPSKKIRLPSVKLEPIPTPVLTSSSSTTEPAGTTPSTPPTFSNPISKIPNLAAVLQPQPPSLKEKEQEKENEMEVDSDSGAGGSGTLIGDALKAALKGREALVGVTPGGSGIGSISGTPMEGIASTSTGVEVAVPSLTGNPNILIPDYTIDIINRSRSRGFNPNRPLYTPRLLSFSNHNADSSGNGFATDGAGPSSSMGRRRNPNHIPADLPRYMRNMPSVHPGLWPIAGSGESSGAIPNGNGLEGYGKQDRSRSRGRRGREGHHRDDRVGSRNGDGDVEDDETDDEEEEMIPLEGSYASSLHPLPPSLPHFNHNNGPSSSSHGHTHRHHHRSRDRRRKVSASMDASGQIADLDDVGEVMNGSLSAVSMARDRSAGSIQELATITSVKREGKRKRERDEAGEMDMYETNVAFQVNPVGGMLKKVTKCITSKDWKTAWQEIKLARTMERIDQLKEEERWSFRQRKKFRGPPMPKSHWDWMLDEMSWMAIDFKEERRWKIATAFELAGWVKLWHSLGQEERGEISVGGRIWGAPSRLIMTEDGQVGFMPNDRLHLPIPEQAEEVEPISTSAALLDEQGVDDALDLAMEAAPDAAKVEETKQDKATATSRITKMEVDTAQVSRAASTLPDATSEMDAEGEDDDGEEFVGDLQAIAGAQASAEGAAAVARANDDHTQHAQRLSGALNAFGQTAAGEAVMMGMPGAELDEVNNAEERIPQIRKPILDLGPTATVISMKELLSDQEKALFPFPPTLADLFGDLLPYMEPTEDLVNGKYDKRRDESTAQASKLAHTTRLMEVRPILVSSLQPAKNRRDGVVWERMDQDTTLDDYMSFPDSTEAVHPEMIPALFRGKRPKATEVGPAPSPVQPRNSELKAQALVWEPEEDAALRELVPEFASNWNLVSDVFNSLRLTVSIDKKSPWDCYERHRKLLEQDAAAAAGPSTSSAPAGGNASVAPVVAMHIDGVLQVDTNVPSDPGMQTSMPSAVTTGTGEDNMMDVDPTNNPGQRNSNRPNRPDGPKKKVRQYYVREAIKRTQKRRDQTSKRPTGGTGARVEVRPDGTTVMNVHESHSQYVNHMTSMSPQKLSMMAFHNAKQQAQMEAERIKETARRNQLQQQQMYQQRALQAQQQQAATAAAIAQQAAQQQQVQQQMAMNAQNQQNQQNPNQGQNQQQQMMAQAQAQVMQQQQQHSRPTPPNAMMNQQLPQVQQAGMPGRPSSAASQQSGQGGQGGQQQVQMPMQQGQMPPNQGQGGQGLTPAQMNQMMQMALQAQQPGNGVGPPLRMTPQQTQLALQQHAQNQAVAQAQAQAAQSQGQQSPMQGQGPQMVQLPNGQRVIAGPNGMQRVTSSPQDNPGMAAAIAAANARRTGVTPSPVSAGAMPIPLAMQGSPRVNGQAIPRPMSSASQHSASGGGGVPGSPQVNRGMGTSQAGSASGSQPSGTPQMMMRTLQGGQGPSTGQGQGQGQQNPSQQQQQQPSPQQMASIIAQAQAQSQGQGQGPGQGQGQPQPQQSQVLQPQQQQPLIRRQSQTQVPQTQAQGSPRPATPK